MDFNPESPGATRNPAVVAWGRPLDAPTKMHAIVDLDRGGSRITACGGRWSVHESQLITRDLVTPGDPCWRCGMYAADQALDALLATPRTVETVDAYDLGGEA